MNLIQLEVQANLYILNSSRDVKAEDIGIPVLIHGIFVH